MPLTTPALMAISVLLVFLHGGVLAAPLSYEPAQHVVVINTTSPGEAGGRGTLVHLDIAPQEPLNFADFAVVQQASIQSFFDASGSFFESVTGFFHRLASHFYPHHDPQGIHPTPTPV